MLSAIILLSRKSKKNTMVRSQVSKKRPHRLGIKGAHLTNRAQIATNKINLQPARPKIPKIKSRVEESNNQNQT